MSERGLNQTADGLYAFDFVELGLMKRAAEDAGLPERSELRFHYPDDQDLLIIMQPADTGGINVYELGYVTPDQLRDALRGAGLLPEPVSGLTRTQ